MLGFYVMGHSQFYSFKTSHQIIYYIHTITLEIGKTKLGPYPYVP